MQPPEHDSEFEVGEHWTENGRGQIRFAFQVPDVEKTLQRAIEHGAKLVHEPTLTPRIQAPDGLQITLYQEVGSG